MVSILASAGIPAEAVGGGVHWHVEITRGSRALRVSCFWYDARETGLVLGMNPSNARSGLAVMPAPYSGPEYYVVLSADDSRVANGRTRVEAEVVACARGWLAGHALDSLVGEVPFVDEARRALSTLAARMDASLRAEVTDELGCQLWVYADGRSCGVRRVDGVAMCRFLLGHAQIAVGASLSDIPTAVATWLVDRAPVRELAQRVPGVEVERHAEVLEVDPARWHWLHVRDRIANPGDVLAPLHDLIAALAESPIASQFYSYSSLMSFCFSASSHYPWVDDGLPVLLPSREGGYRVNGERYELAAAVAAVEGLLAAAPVKPFFGSAPHHEAQQLAETLTTQGSSLRPVVKQERQWFELVVEAPPRKCKVHDPFVTFTDGLSRLDAKWPSLEVAVRAIRRFLEESAALETIATDRDAKDAKMWRLDSRAAREGS
jgi:hypothetical protein